MGRTKYWYYFQEGERGVAIQYCRTNTFFSEQVKIKTFLRMLPDCYRKEFACHGVLFEHWITFNSIMFNLDMVRRDRVPALLCRDKFYSRRQNIGESCEEYLQALVKLTKNCNFKDSYKYWSLHEQFLHGVRNVKVRQAFASCGTEYKSEEEDKQLLEDAMVCAKRMEKLERLKKAKKNKIASVQMDQLTRNEAADDLDGSLSPECQVCDFSVYVPNFSKTVPLCKYCDEFGHYTNHCRKRIIESNVSKH